MEKKTKVLGAAGAVAAAAVGVGVAVSRRKGAPETYRIKPTDAGWEVVKEGADRASSTHGTKKEALSAGRKLAGGRAPSSLVLHYADGREQKRIDYPVD